VPRENSSTREFNTKYSYKGENQRHDSDSSDHERLTTITGNKSMQLMMVRKLVGKRSRERKGKRQGCESAISLEA